MSIEIQKLDRAIRHNIRHIEYIERDYEKTFQTVYQLKKQYKELTGNEFIRDKQAVRYFR